MQKKEFNPNSVPRSVHSSSVETSPRSIKSAPSTPSIRSSLIKIENQVSYEENPFDSNEQEPQQMVSEHMLTQSRPSELKSENYCSDEG